MSKISYPQIIKDVADAIRTGTKTTDLIPVGELAGTILALLTRNPASGETSDVAYKSIVYNDDNTVTLIDQDDVVHTIVCEYNGDKLVAIQCEGKYVEMTYDGDSLIKVADTEVDLSNAKVTPATSSKNIDIVGVSATDIIISTVTITSELKPQAIKVVGLSVTDKE